MNGQVPFLSVAVLTVAGFLTGPSRLFNIFDVVLVVNSKLWPKLALHGRVRISRLTPWVLWAPSTLCWAPTSLPKDSPAWPRPLHRIVELTLADNAPNGLNLSWP